MTNYKFNVRDFEVEVFYEGKENEILIKCKEKEEDTIYEFDSRFCILGKDCYEPLAFLEYFLVNIDEVIRVEKECLICRIIEKYQNEDDEQLYLEVPFQEKQK